MTSKSCLVMVVMVWAMVIVGAMLVIAWVLRLIMNVIRYVPLILTVYVTLQPPTECLSLQVISWVLAGLYPTTIGTVAMVAGGMRVVNPHYASTLE